MLDIKFIRENLQLVKDNCSNRRIQVDLEELLKMYEERTNILQEVEDLRAQRNLVSKGKPTDEEIVHMREVGERIKERESALKEVDVKYHNLLLQVPNLTHKQSPVGGEENFHVLSTNEQSPSFDFTPRDHEELMLKNDLIDFERATKVTGAKFYFCKNDLVHLNLALINYGLGVVEKHGYTAFETPDLAKDEILSGIGFNPRGSESQIYSIENSDLSLIGTAEITMGGYHSNEILDLSKGAKKYVALSHCFRIEAGAYGRTSKGLYRVHQFTKLEMFVFCEPEESEKYHEEILTIEKEIVDGLKLPYRVIDIASGDLGGPAYRKYDIEAWMVMKASAGSVQGDYGEITSCSNCTDYQARRLNIKYHKADGSTEFVHTLNGTAINTSRFPLAIIENYQQKDGTIEVPKVLRDFMGKKMMGI